MTPRSLLPFILAVALFALQGCMLDRAGLSAMPGGRLSVSPALACPGDTVTIAWDTHRSFNPGFCAFPNGNRPTLQSCESQLDCGTGGGLCIDGFCNSCSIIASARTRETECASPSNRGCQPSLTARIQVTPEPDPPLLATNIFQHQGERQFVVGESCSVTFLGDVIDVEGGNAGLAGSTGRVDLTQRVEVVDPDLTRTAANSYLCLGSPSWPGTRLEQLFADASPNLRLIGIHNPNRFAVVGNLDGAPLRLAAGERVVLNHPVTGPIQAQPVQEFLMTLPPVQCTPVQSIGSYPGAPLELTVGCVSTD